MKQTIIASMLFAALSAAPACYASNDSEQAASDVSALSVLAVAVTPAVVTYSGAGAVVGAGHQLVKLVDATGDGLSELTADGINQIDKALSDTPDPCDHGVNRVYPTYVILNKKEIPLVVRPGYVELNEKVKTK